MPEVIRPAVRRGRIVIERDFDVFLPVDSPPELLMQRTCRVKIALTGLTSPVSPQSLNKLGCDVARHDHIIFAMKSPNGHSCLAL